MDTRIALFGGTFDPVHDGHVFVAERAQGACQLDRVIFVPCWQSPHKPEQSAAAAEHRINMIELATADLAWVDVSDWEIQRPEPSVSWQTACHFREVYPDAKLYWLLGVDQWKVLETWSHPEVLAELLTFIVFGRDGDLPQPKDGFRHVFVPGMLEVSSTEIRATIDKGITPANIAPQVLEYAIEHGLYRTTP